MDNLVKEAVKLFSLADETIDLLNGKTLPRKLINSINNYQSNKNHAYKYFKNELPADEKLLDNSIKNALSNIRLMYSALAESNDLLEVSRLTAESKLKCSELIKAIDRKPVKFSQAQVPAPAISSTPTSSEQILKREAESLRSFIFQQTEEHKKTLSETLGQIADLEVKVANLTSLVNGEISKAYEESKNTITELEIKRKAINDLLGTISGDSVSGTFENSSESEKKMAEIFRGVSLVLMSAGFLLASYTLYISVSKGLAWDESIFRIALILLISVPVAYLTKESAKHRNKYYEHKQTALELRALDPYLASLPEEQRHKLKAEMSTSFFSKPSERVEMDENQTLNIQDLMMELIRRLDKKS